MAKGGISLEVLILEFSSRRATTPPGSGRYGLARTMLHVTYAATPANRETSRERLRGSKGYPLESMPGVRERDNDRMNFAWPIQRYALEQRWTCQEPASHLSTTYQTVDGA